MAFSEQCETKKIVHLNFGTQSIIQNETVLVIFWQCLITVYGNQ